MRMLLRLSGLLLATGLDGAASGAESIGIVERFPHDRSGRNILIAPAGERAAVICRYRSRAGNCFRLTPTDGSMPAGAITAPLDSEKMFRQFASELLFDAGGLRICEIAENWSPWRAVAAAARQARQVDAEERFCSPGIVSDAPACPCRSLRESRKRLVAGPS